MLNNSSGIHDSSTRMHHDEYIIMVAVLVSVPITMLNIFTIIIILICKKLRKPRHIPIVSFLFASAIQSLFVLPIYTHKTLENISSHRQPWVCDLYRFPYFYTQHIIKVSLLVVSFDRLVAIKYPYRYPAMLNRVTVGVIVLLLWFVTLLIDFIPYLAGGKKGNCLYVPNHDWGLSVILIFDIFPFIVITINYVVLWRIAASITKETQLQKAIAETNSNNNKSNEGYLSAVIDKVDNVDVVTSENNSRGMSDDKDDRDNTLNSNAVSNSKDDRDIMLKSNAVSNSKDDRDNTLTSNTVSSSKDNRDNTLTYNAVSNSKNDRDNILNYNGLSNSKDDRDNILNYNAVSNSKDDRDNTLTSNTVSSSKDEKIAKKGRHLNHSDTTNNTPRSYGNAFKFAWEMKATRTSILVCLAYAVCWLPMGIFYFVDHICSECLSDEHSKNITIVKKVIKFVCLASSVFLPVVYCWRTKEFREEVTRIFCKKTYRKRKLMATAAVLSFKNTIAVIALETPTVNECEPI